MNRKEQFDNIYTHYLNNYVRTGSSVEGKLSTSDFITRVDMPKKEFDKMFDELFNIPIIFNQK